jgi:hypothetical protein
VCKIDAERDTVRAGSRRRDRGLTARRARPHAARRPPRLINRPVLPHGPAAGPSPASDSYGPPLFVAGRAAGGGPACPHPAGASAHTRALPESRRARGLELSGNDDGHGPMPPRCEQRETRLHSAIDTCMQTNFRKRRRAYYAS